MRYPSLLFALLCLFACDACGAGGGGLPRAIRDLANGGEAMEFSGWEIPGLRLYRINHSVPDRSVTRIVGLDEAGAVVSGADLLARVPELPARDLAVRVLAIMMGAAGAEPLLASSPPSTFATEAEWALITDPAIDAGVLTFWIMRGEMAPELVRVQVVIVGAGEERTLDIHGAREVLLASGEAVPLGPPTCVPVAHCGCWSGCERVVPIELPNDAGLAYRREDGSLLRRREECLGEACFRICRADSPSATCDDGVIEAPNEACTEACPPSEAGYHCETLETSCREVTHAAR